MATRRVGHIWFTGKDTIGIVLLHDEETSKFKSYIGVGVGVSAEMDLKHIQSYGTEFPTNTAITLVLDKGTADIPLEELYDLVIKYS